MTLKTFKNHILKFEEDKVFDFSLSTPFSWRGSYDEFAFEVSEGKMNRDSVLENIQRAFTEVFHGYKGGQYTYDNETPVNFEEHGSRNYTDGRFTAELLAKLEHKDVYESKEHRLVALAFS